jgi:hypothetical protein
MTFDKTKTYHLRDGFQYRFYSDEAGGICPIHGAYLVGEQEGWLPIRHTPDLAFDPFREGRPHGLDLVEIPAYDHFKIDEPQVNLRVVNVTDPSMVHDAMSSSQGERLILNAIQKTPTPQE